MNYLPCVATVLQRNLNHTTLSAGFSTPLHQDFVVKNRLRSCHSTIGCVTFFLKKVRLKQMKKLADALPVYSFAFSVMLLMIY